MTEGRSNSDLPAEDFFAITPDDANDVAVNCRALIVTVSGTVKFTKLNGNTATLTLPAGVIPIRFKRIWATGTTATGLSGLV